MDYPSPADATTCDELLAQLHQAHRSRIAAITDISEVVRFEPLEDPVFAAFGTRWALRDSQLGCQFMQDPPPEMQAPPTMTPANPAQEMALADLDVMTPALRGTARALEQYRAEYDTYPTTIGELRYATGLREPAAGTTVDIVWATTDRACLRAEADTAPYPVFLAIPERRPLLDPCPR